MTVRRIFACLTCLASVGVAGSAGAQEGIGIRTGNLELHPTLKGEVGYDSNYSQSSGETAEPEVAAIRFRISPSLTLQTLGPKRRAAPGPGEEPDKIAFSANVGVAYNELIATDSAQADDVSAQRHLSAQAGLKLDIFPKGKWGADLFATYVRSIEPTNALDTPIAGTPSAFDRDSVAFGAGINWRPGGGLFQWRVGYEGRVVFFEDAGFQDFNNIHHYAKTRGRWLFLPRTALLYDAELGFVTFTTANSQPSSTPVRSRIGISGLITDRFEVLGRVGWGASFNESASGEPIQDFDSVLANAELKWHLQRPEPGAGTAPTGVSWIATGYSRDFSISYLGSYYQKDRVYGDFQYHIASAAALKLGGGYALISHPESYFPGTATVRSGAFTENRVDVIAQAEYFVSETVGVFLTGLYDASLNDNRIPTDPGLASSDNLRFSRYQIWLGARWFM